MDNIKDIVHGVIGKISNQQSKNRVNLDMLLRNVLEDSEVEHTQIVGEKEGVLLICVDSPIVKHHLKTKENLILKKIKEKIPQINSIRWKLGKIK